MTSRHSQARHAVDDEAHHPLDCASWVYLGCSPETGARGRLRERVARFCEASGWHAVSWSQKEGVTAEPEPGRLFQGIRHAVQHADVFVAFVGEGTELADVELSLAYSCRRPIVAMCATAEGEDGAGVQAMLRRYERARVVVSTDVEESVSGLHSTFADPEFAETIRLAAHERADA